MESERERGILTNEEIAKIATTCEEVMAYSKKLEEEREMKQKRSYDLNREKMRSPVKIPHEELYKTLKEMKAISRQHLGNKLSTVEEKIRFAKAEEAVSEFAALQTYIYDGFKSSLPTDRALIFPQELGAFLCELLEQHRKLYFELKSLMESQCVMTDLMVPKMLAVFPLTKTKEIFRNRIEADLKQAEGQSVDRDVPGILQLFQDVVERQKAILGFTLLAEGALELWQGFDSFLAAALAPVLAKMDLQEFANACSVVRLKLYALQNSLVTSSASVTKVNFRRAFTKTNELLIETAVSHIADLGTSLESGFAQFLSESILEPPDLNVVQLCSDVDIDSTEAMIEALDSAATCLKPQINPGDMSEESDTEEHKGTKNPDAVAPNKTELQFEKSAMGANTRVKVSAKSIPNMVQFMKESQFSIVNRLTLTEADWDKRYFSAINVDEVHSEEFKLEDIAIKQARVLHGNVFVWPKKVTTALRRLVEHTIDKYTLFAYSNEKLLLNLCTNLTTQITATLALYEGERQLQLFRLYPAKAVALIIGNLIVLRGRQEQLYTLLRITAKQLLPEESYVLSHLKQQRCINSLLTLLDSKLQADLSILLSGLDCESWSDQKVRHTSKGPDQPSYGLVASSRFISRTTSMLESTMNKEMSAVVVAKIVRYWAVQVSIKYCSGIAPSRVRLAQFLQDLDYTHIAFLDTFHHLCDLLPALGEDSDIICWELFLSLKALWQGAHTLFLTSHIIRLQKNELVSLIRLLGETSAFQPEMSDADWQTPAILTQAAKNSGAELRLHIRDAVDYSPEQGRKGPENPQQPGALYFADIASREFNSAFALFLKMRGKYPGKYTVFHFLWLFCLASSNSMKEQLEKSLPIMFQNRARAYRSYEEMVLSDNNLRDFFTLPVSKFVSVARMRPEMLTDPFPPLSEEDQQNRKELDRYLSMLKSVEPRSASVDESAVQSPS